MTKNMANLIIMAKAPLPGVAKTRLAGALGYQQAADLYRCFLLDVLECARASGLSLHLAYTPAASKEIFQELTLQPLDLLAQTGANLGERMRNAVSMVYARNRQPCLVIGADLPTLQPAHLAEAVRALRTNDLCLGPAADGGYYLIGFNRPEPGVFAGITWGSDQVLTGTLAQITRLSLSCQLLTVLRDIDEMADLAYLQAELRNPLLTYFPEHTWQFMQILTGRGFIKIPRLPLL